jgi:hypothetical protein
MTNNRDDRDINIATLRKMQYRADLNTAEQQALITWYFNR